MSARPSFSLPVAVVFAVLAWALLSCSPRAVVNEDARAPEERTAAMAALGEISSPFFQVYEDSPVAWVPFTPGVFETARTEEKPILLHISFSTCPFTRRLAGDGLRDTSFSRFINEHFVCALLDSEEFLVPSAIYLEMQPLLGALPAWPMLMWTTPRGVPFHAHVFGPDESFRPESLSRSARVARELWESGPRVPETLAGETWQRFVRQVASDPAEEVERERVFPEAYHQIMGNYDSVHGSVSAGQNFPRPLALQFMMDLHDVFREGDFRRERIEEALLNCLDSIARGGIHDVLDGGFFRYSEKPGWDEPHSEKLLTDQALMAEVYARAAVRYPGRGYMEVAERTLDHAYRRFLREDGVFGHATSAFAELAPGMSAPFLAPYYRWHIDEVSEVVGDPVAMKVFARFHGMDELGRSRMRFGDGRPAFPGAGEELASIAADAAITEAAAAALLETAREALLATREAREGRFVDDRATLAGNALMVSAMVAVAEAGGNEVWRERARETYAAALRVFGGDEGLPTWQSAWRESRAPLLQGTDLVLLVKAAADLATANGLERYRDDAVRFLRQFEREFVDPETRFPFFGWGSDFMPENVRWAGISDGALPADPGTLAGALRVLHGVTGDADYPLWRKQVIDKAMQYPDQILNAHVVLGEEARDVARAAAAVGADR